MSEGEFQYVFGPVVSRRLGRSLGVDVVPFKTCVYDCVYCQLGKTTRHTAARAEYVPLDALLDEVSRKVADAPDAADYITIAGSGEPTLYSRLAELVDGIKAITPIPIAVITNGALLYDRAVQDALLRVDLVVPSLDAGDSEAFERVNAACADVDFDTMVDGLVSFRARYRGQFWLEVFLLGGVTDTDEQVTKLAAIVARIRPDRVQLNTVSRPAPGGRAMPVPRDRMEAIAAQLGHGAEVIAHYAAANAPSGGNASAKDLLDVIRRHPCTLEDAALGLGISLEVARGYADQLVAESRLREDLRDGKTFYIAEHGRPDQEPR